VGGGGRIDKEIVKGFWPLIFQPDEKPNAKVTQVRIKAYYGIQKVRTKYNFRI
jgi:hypothetical protein